MGESFATALVAGGSPWLVAIFVILCQILTVVGVVYAKGLGRYEDDPPKALDDFGVVGR